MPWDGRMRPSWFGLIWSGLKRDYYVRASVPDLGMSSNPYHEYCYRQKMKNLGSKHSELDYFQQVDLYYHVLTRWGCERDIQRPPLSTGDQSCHLNVFEESDLCLAPPTTRCGEFHVQRAAFGQCRISPENKQFEQGCLPPM